MLNKVKSLFSGKSIIFVTLLFCFASTTLFAQATTIKLPTTDNTSSFNVTKSDDFSMLKLNADGGFYLQGTFGSGAIPTTGAGTRLMFYPAKSAFRAGYIDGVQWNTANIGDYSTAMGVNTIASGFSSTALGNATTASGTASIAFGGSTTASGEYSTAMGYNTTASDWHTTAIGNTAIASAWGATAIGFVTTASGVRSTAMGNYVSTNGTSGSFIIGDNSTTTVTNSDANNQMKMRFTGGYKLLGGGTLQNAGLIESTSGGIKFPDGTTQTTAAGASSWTASGNDIYNSNSGKVDIKTSLTSSGTIESTSGGFIFPDGTTQTTASSAPAHYIGESYGGGIVFWVDATGQHGLIAAPSDHSTTMRWSAGANTYTMAKGTGYGAGEMNTAIIIANQGYGDGSTYAARICAEYQVDGYSDWYLPSKFELEVMYQQKDIIGGFNGQFYWSSTEYSNYSAWIVTFTSVYVVTSSKTNNYYVRAVRAF